MDQIAIASLCDWTPGKQVRTAQGPRILRKANPSEAFSKLWKSNKAALKAAGLGWSKAPSGDWEVCWWQQDTETAVAQEAAVVASAATDAQIDVPAPAGCTYLPFQRAGIAWGLSHPAALIADEMGCGKTPQAIGVINGDPSVRRVLIVVPASLRLNWQRELSKWLVRPLSIGIATGKEWPAASDVVILGYDSAPKHIAAMRAQVWDLVVLDESTYVKNPKAKRSIAILGRTSRDPEEKLAPVAARRRLALSGTPILNRTVEFQSVLGWLAPEEFGNFWKFAQRYCGAKRNGFGWDFSGASHLDELQHRLRSTVMIRRLKSEVLDELPAKRRQIIEIAANGNSSIVAREQKALAKHAETTRALRDALQLAKVLEDADAYAAAVAALQEGQTAAFQEMALIRHDIAVAKVPYVVEHVADASEAAPVVLFAWHVDVIDSLVAGLTEAGRRCVKLVGGMSDQQKQASVDAFQAGKADVFVGNIKAAGVGITLVISAHVVFAEEDWVPANVSQAEDRTHRIGQKNSVLVQHIVLEGSLDQVMAKAIVDKQEIADAALDDPLARREIAEPIDIVTVLEAPEKRAVSTDRPAKPDRVYSAEDIAKLQAGLIELSMRCDGARQIDGAGFSKMDVRFGKALAAQERPFSQYQAEIANRLCVRYRRQIGTILP